ncbi:hypothetical protein MUN89_04155 [Halobacillus salinarum]|uniref:Uncharacterized protein n=1 Tax=Halobacillus salinarum TaxID=2932257 RepID=A0ABY4EL13_9BACI|nr:hypothetical protein [Halobacillus salinarum]UOQ45156.1 hypothetical protein MUN89_04155 [Halobacillus salinarum]
MQQTISRYRKYLLPAALVLTVSLIVIINLFNERPLENLSRSLIVFAAVPLWILYANQHQLWFRNKLRWMIRASNRLLINAAVFFVGVLASYEVFLMLPYSLGVVFHLTTLTICSFFYWLPLLLHCTFSRRRPHMQRLGYFALTSMLFFVYHMVSFQYYDGTPTQGFLVSGLFVMLLTLIYLFQDWSVTEKEDDRTTVEGYVRPVSKERKF